MDSLAFLFDLLLHLDQHLIGLIQTFGSWTYVILFGIVFVETGIVIFPFLPGDSLLFVAGTLAAAGALNVWLLFALFAIAAILGDSVNYALGKSLGVKAFQKWLKPEHLKRTEEFFQKYGAKTIVLARFFPVIRTIAPFVAGIGKMEYKKFLAFNVLGGILWTALFVGAGYFFGNIPIVKENFSAVIIFIIIISLIPALVEFARMKAKK
ncbi:MAG: DedA family protein [Candidatus Diapherotrites archaeon]